MRARRYYLFPGICRLGFHAPHIDVEFINRFIGQQASIDVGTVMRKTEMPIGERPANFSARELSGVIDAGDAAAYFKKRHEENFAIGIYIVSRKLMRRCTRWHTARFSLLPQASLFVVERDYDWCSVHYRRRRRRRRRGVGSGKLGHISAQPSAASLRRRE